VPTAIRDAGYPVQTIHEVYGSRKAQWVQDPRWIRRCANEQWVAITRDYLTIWRGVICEDAVRIFRVARSAETEDEQAEYVAENMAKITRLARKPGPYVYRIDRNDVEKVFPTEAVPCP
jgi:hypothetical protein